MRFLTDMLLPGSKALKMWKACRNQEACGHFQASRRHCAVVYLLCLGHLRFAGVAARHPSSYFNFAFSWNFPRRNGRCQGQTLACLCKTAPCLVPTLQLLLLQWVTGKVYMLTYVNLWSFHQLKKQNQWHMGVSYKSGLSCGQRYWISVAKMPSVLWNLVFYWWIL